MGLKEEGVMPRELLSITDAARALRIRYQVTARLIRSRKLKAVRIQGRLFVVASDLPRVRRERPWSPRAMRRFGH
jgi:hypothetical protein